MTGCPSSWKCAVACCWGEESQQRDVAALQAAAQRDPRGALVQAGLAVRRRRPSSTVGWLSRSAQTSPMRPASRGVRRGLVALLLGAVEHRLLDVEHRQHVGDHLGGDGAGLADLQDPPPLGLDHLHPDPVVERGRRLLVLGGAEPLPGREVALVEPLPDQVDDAGLVVVLDAARAPRSAGLGRLLEQGRAGQRVVERVRAGHLQPAREPPAASAPGSAACRPRP